MLTDKQKQRITNYIKQLYLDIFYIKDHTLMPYDDLQILNAQYAGFIIGVMMSDPHGQWRKKFNKLYDETRKEYQDAKLGGREYSPPWKERKHPRFSKIGIDCGG